MLASSRSMLYENRPVFTWKVIYASERQSSTSSHSSLFEERPWTETKISQASLQSCMLGSFQASADSTLHSFALLRSHQKLLHTKWQTEWQMRVFNITTFRDRVALDRLINYNKDMTRRRSKREIIFCLLFLCSPLSFFKNDRRHFGSDVWNWSQTTKIGERYEVINLIQKHLLFF